MSWNGLSDEELIVEISRDQWGAFAELYSRYKAQIFSFFKRRTNVEMAEDLVQKCFMRIHEKAHSFNSDYLAPSWIFTLARNLMYDEFRSIERQGKLNEKYAQEFQSVTPQEVWESVQEDVAKLDEKQRQLIYWRYREGHDFEEIADFLKTSKANARQLVSRAIRSLRVQIETENES